MTLGEEARKLDEEKTIRERAKLGKAELLRVLWAILFYFATLGLMALLI
jgi:hypothetical protein